MLACLLALLLACQPAEAATLFVARRGWHVEVGFAVDATSKPTPAPRPQSPVAPMPAPLDAVAAQFPGVRYLFFGFGDRRYLQARHRGAPVLLAALWPGRGLILATALRATPAQAFGDLQVTALEVRAEELQQAERFVWNSLTAEQQTGLSAGAEQIPGPYTGSLFLETTAVYSAAHTCNTWAAETLAHGGVPIRPRGIVFAGQVWRRVQRIARGLQPPNR